MVNAKALQKMIYLDLPQQQHGVALIIVMFLLALATIVVTTIINLVHVNMDRTSAFLETKQAYLLCLSGEEWARQLLAEDYKLNPNIDHVHEEWAKDGKILDVSNGYIEVAIVDAQGLFNINNLVEDNGTVDANSKIAFTNLLTLYLRDQQASTVLASEAVDWLDIDSNNGVEEADYLSLELPYRPPNSRVTNISELRWLRDMDVKQYKVLHDHLFSQLVALPHHTSYNINTLSSVVLAALAGTDIAQAEGIIRNIQAAPNGIENVGTAGAMLPANVSSILTPELVTYSEYFVVRVRAKFAGHYAFLQSLVFRDHEKNGAIQVISRDRSQRFIFPFSRDYNASKKDNEFEVKLSI